MGILTCTAADLPMLATDLRATLDGDSDMDAFALVFDDSEEAAAMDLDATREVICTARTLRDVRDFLAERPDYNADSVHCYSVVKMLDCDDWGNAVLADDA